MRFRRSSSRLLPLLLLLVSLVSLATPAVYGMGQGRSPEAGREVSSPVPTGQGGTGLKPAATQSTNYYANLHATQNATGSTADLSVGSSTPWNEIGSSVYYYESFTITGASYSWNGTFNFIGGVQLQFHTGHESVFTVHSSCVANIGFVFANLTVGRSVYSDRINFENHITSGCNDVVDIAPTWSVPSPAIATPLKLNLTCDPEGGATGAYSFATQPPEGFSSHLIPGGSGISSPFVGTSLGSAGSFSVTWGWKWLASPSSPFAFTVPPDLSSVSLSWSSPYHVNATYNSVTQTSATSGTFTLSTPRTISFQTVGNLMPVSTYSFVATYTITGTVVTQFILTYNFTQPWAGGVLKTTSSFAATTVSPWNATWSEYTYTIPTPYANVTRVWAAANLTWPLVTAWPAGYYYTSANNTVTWPGVSLPGSPAGGGAESPDTGTGEGVPTYIQVVFLAPVQYGSAILSIIYIPASPIFSLFGAALPFSAVNTYVNGLYQPYAAVPATLGQSLIVQTYDIFNHLLYSGTVNVTQSDQVDAITLDIWPMSIVNLNSSYVVALNLRNYGVTQIAPDLMPLQSYVFYLPQGLYNFTLQYLAFGGGAVGAPFTFALNISGVSYDVINGLTFLSVIANEQAVGNNLTKVITGVNLTVLSTAASLENLINSFSAGLFSYHLVTGTATRTANSFSVPITVTTGTGAPANLSVTRQMAETLVLTLINSTGTWDLPCFASGANPGTFTLSFTLNDSQVSSLLGGTAAVIMTATATYGSTALIGTGVVAGALISTALKVGAPVDPLSQNVFLTLSNTSRDSTSGFSTSTGSWTNPFNQSFSGQLTLEGGFVGAGVSSVSVSINGTILSSSQWALTDTGLIVFAGVVDVPVGTTITVSVTYERSSTFNLQTTPLVQFGPVPITTPYLVLIVGLFVVGAAGVEDLKNRSKTLDAVTAAALFLVVFGGMILV